MLSISYLSSSCYFRRNSNHLQGEAIDRAWPQTCLQENGYLWLAIAKLELALKFRVPRRPNIGWFDLMCFAARENGDGNVEHDRLLAVTRMYRHFCRDKTA